MHVYVHLSMFKQKVFHVAQAGLKVTVSWDGLEPPARPP